MPITPPRPTSGATISRSVYASSRARRSAIARGSRHGVVDDLRARLGREGADDALAEDDVIGHDLLGDRRPRRRWRGRSGRRRSGRKTALVAAVEQLARPTGDALEELVEVERRRDLAAHLGERRHLGRAALRLAVELGVPDRGADVRRDRREQARRPHSPKRPASSMLWTLTAPIASSPTRIGTPRYERTRGPDALALDDLELLRLVEEQRLARLAGSARSGPRQAGSGSARRRHAVARRGTGNRSCPCRGSSSATYDDVGPERRSAAARRSSWMSRSRSSCDAAAWPTLVDDRQLAPPAGGSRRRAARSRARRSGSTASVVRSRSSESLKASVRSRFWSEMRPRTSRADDQRHEQDRLGWLARDDDLDGAALRHVRLDVADAGAARDASRHVDGPSARSAAASSGKRTPRSIVYG